MPMFKYIAEVRDDKTPRERAVGEIEAEDMREARLCMSTWVKTMDVPVRYAITFMIPGNSGE